MASSAAYQREWRKKNADKVRRYTAKYYAERKNNEEYKAKARERSRMWHKKKVEKDPEGLRVRTRAYYERNKEEIKTRVKAQRKKDPEGTRERRRAKYYANAEAARAATREWRKRNPERVRENNLKKFGIGVVRYEALLRSQNGGCAICGGQNPNGKALAVDHCHKTGKIRGLLCSKCNTGVGLFRDNAELLKKAAEYIAGDTSWRLKLADEYVAKWSDS